MKIAASNIKRSWQNQPDIPDIFLDIYYFKSSKHHSKCITSSVSVDTTYIELQTENIPFLRSEKKKRKEKPAMS